MCEAMQHSKNTANVKASVFSISRLRMGTDGEGITTLVTFMGCPLGCPPRDRLHTVTMRLDRPFVFAIKGDHNQLLFMGAMKKMEC